ncbi:MAG: GGDEF domain-containing protein [Methylocystaceae bacterium]|nr:GGDEF domain-containing protein [Methylocystaceae bacterium]
MSFATQNPTWTLVKLALLMTRPFALIAAGFGLAALLGYFLQVDTLYRPLVGGPATNPLTALCFLLLGVAVFYTKDKQDNKIKLASAACAFTLIFCRLMDQMAGTDFAIQMTPFQSVVETELAAGKQNAMGVNSALMLGFISLSLLLHGFMKLIAAQIIAFLALAIPVVSYTGYAYGYDDFYGQMSFLTATIGIILSSALLSSTAHIGGMKAILSPYVGGKKSRVQMIMGIAIPFMLGFLFVKTLMHTQHTDLFGVFVVTIIWFISSLVVVSAYFQEQIDEKRRDGEAELLRRATVDPLTQLANRRYFFEIAEREMERSNRTNMGFSLLMLDLDHFKKINETAGHSMGDKVLQEVAKLLHTSVRAVDVVGRFGGEEFAILLCDTPPKAAEQVAEKIRRQIETLQIDGWTNMYGPLTASLGLAGSINFEYLEECMQAADIALYKAKQSGRNQVVIAK